MSKTEITFSGYGGQGVVISSIMCANALSLEGFNVLQTQSHGIEARGGASKGELIYSESEVNYLQVENPDLLIMLSEEAFKKYSASVKNDGVMIVDSFYTDQSLIDQFAENHAGVDIYAARFSQISIEKFEVALFTNVIVLGYLCGVHQKISLESMEESVKKYIKAKFIEKNLEALKLGYEMAIEELKHKTGNKTVMS